jgi:hypothetical protein
LCSSRTCVWKLVLGVWKLALIFIVRKWWSDCILSSVYSCSLTKKEKKAFKKKNVEFLNSLCYWGLGFYNIKTSVPKLCNDLVSATCYLWFLILLMKHKQTRDLKSDL